MYHEREIIRLSDLLIPGVLFSAAAHSKQRAFADTEIIDEEAYEK